MMEPSAVGKTEIKIVEGAQYDKGLTNRHFITNAESQSAELDNPLVLLIESKVDSIRQIQTVLEYVIKNNKPLLVIGDLEKGVLSALAMNKIKGNIKINVIDAPTFGVNRKQLLDDLSLLTGATIINEDLGDDLDLIKVEYLGTNFVGWQIQKNGLSVQEVLEKALSKFLKNKISIMGSGRTDAGVHANEQSALSLIHI